MALLVREADYLVRSQRKWALPEGGKLWEKMDKAPVLGHVRWQLRAGRGRKPRERGQSRGVRLEQVTLSDGAKVLYMVIAWRINWLGRTLGELPADLVFETDEWKAAFILNKKPVPQIVPQLNTVIGLMAQREGVMTRKGDGGAGAKEIWLGMQDVAVFVEGIRYARQAGVI